MSNKLPPPPEVSAAFGNPREAALNNMNKVNEMQSTLVQSAGKKFNYKSKASRKSKKCKKSKKSKKCRKSRKYRRYFARGGANGQLEVKVVPTLFNDVGTGNQSSQGSQVAALQNSVNSYEQATYDKNVTLAKPIPATQLSSR